MVIVVMGVTGAGKTTVGSTLAGTLGWRFVDADDLHPAANIAKMAAGVPLTDADRAPWLSALAALIERAIDRREHLVIACSALKERYRAALRAHCRSVRFVYLQVAPEVASSRAGHRGGHFAGASLVATQFETLEPPADALVLDGTIEPEHLVAAIRTEFGI